MNAHETKVRRLSDGSPISPAAISSYGALNLDSSVQRFNKLREKWRSQSLAVQFLLAGGLVSFAAMLIVGLLVTSQIEEGVTRNSAAASALYVDSVIAPLLPDMRKATTLSGPVARALDETLSQGALGSRLVSFKLWGRDGTILYAKDKNLIGQRFPPSEELEAAWTGKVVAEFNQLDDLESATERAAGKPLLEIYNPVLQPWSGEVVAVSEFYEIATDFDRTLQKARLWSWLAVAAETLVVFTLLSAIVFRGSRMIDTQSQALKERVIGLSELLTQNRRLRLRAQQTSQRVTALNERHLRRIGADLHDGPAQLVAFAALRLDSDAVAGPATSQGRRRREIRAIRDSLDQAMREIRSICNGLVLPHIETAELPDILRLAVAEHEQRTGGQVALTMAAEQRTLTPNEKICVYRFVQEALNNSARHAGGAGQAVVQHFEAGRLFIEVSDRGSGFDPAAVRPEGLGLAGMRERVESLGGQFSVDPSESGTTVAMSLASEEAQQP
ncbi:MAG: sensor histidine kinase [Alphaproteobacteria bacterium]|jgi:signal transduction histidine kinase|nr:sensor histidine kinase [Alphaproteobacteria bacterium]MBU0804894.1 sensor histidine kinase [Alphaproteobacteria bacterium]MBU0870393.1 sensor histidine kinase [Alphaproteobacteria bacterium]MBU1401932.1 sensor histidine kinase [Alphaproteobacteria bacterium]MBU1591651.1 sensor histidine kinase [Alphaproteobacteria bacterium]